MLPLDMISNDKLLPLDIISNGRRMGYPPQARIKGKGWGMTQRGRWGLLLVGIVMVAAALRLYQLDQIPYGMDHDEGHNALDAMQIIEGWRPVFLPRNNGREPLFMYLMAASMAVFGPTLWALRLTGAIASLLMLPALYLLMRSLPLPRPHLTALLSVALIAVNFWAISKGHQGLRAGLLPVWVTLMLWAWWKTLQSTGLRGLVWSTLTGLFITTAVYTHLTGRTLPIILLGTAVWAALRGRTWRPLGYALVAIALAAILALPQMLFFMQNPHLFSHRANQTSVFNPAISQGDSVGYLVDNTINLALMFNVRGTLSWSENLRGRPVFDPLIGVAFWVGVLLLARDLLGRRGQTSQLASVMLTLTFGLMLVPSWLSEDAPHYGRLTGIWPVMFLLPGWGLERSAAWLDQAIQKLRLSRLKTARGGEPSPPPFSSYHVSLGIPLAAVLIVISGVWAARDFFVLYAPAQRAAEHFRAINVERGQIIAELTTRGGTYLSPNSWNQSVTRFLTIQNPPRSFDPRHGLVLPPTGDAYYVFEPGEREAADAFEKRWPQTERHTEIDERGEWVVIWFRLPRERWPGLPANASQTQVAQFGEHIRLVGFEIKPDQAVSRGKLLTVTLDWEALTPTELDHNLFVHVVAEGSRGVGQYDGSPLGGSYPTNRWLTGERILQRIEIPITNDAPLGPALVRVGWYDWRTGARLPVVNDDDAAIDIARLEIKR